MILDPNDPEVLKNARQQGIPDDWLDAAQRSPVYALAKKYKVALPLHPEYRTMPMVWYIPPLSPVVDLLRDQGHDAESADVLFGAIDELRIPLEYLAELFTAGDTGEVERVLTTLAAMRAQMRNVTLGRTADESIAAAVGMTSQEVYEMYRLLAIAKYEDRYVIPRPTSSRRTTWRRWAARWTSTVDRTRWVESGPFGEASGRSTPVAVETFHALKQRQTSDSATSDETLRGRVNLLNWDGNGSPPGMFPSSPDATTERQSQA